MERQARGERVRESRQMPTVALLAFSSLVASTALASPGPHATSSGNCAETQAAILKAAQPVYPSAAMRFVQSPISVQVIVYLDAGGSIKTASVAQSSGYADADASALKAATASTYKPRTVDCKPVDGLYLFKADFAPPAPR